MLGAELVVRGRKARGGKTVAGGAEGVCDVRNAHLSRVGGTDEVAGSLHGADALPDLTVRGACVSAGAERVSRRHLELASA